MKWNGDGTDPHHFDADLYPTFHSDTDPAPDPDPNFQMKAQTLKSAQKGSSAIRFGLSSANWVLADLSQSDPLTVRWQWVGRECPCYRPAPGRSCPAEIPSHLQHSSAIKDTAVHIVKADPDLTWELKQGQLDMVVAKFQMYMIGLQLNCLIFFPLF